jgi:hypothetical protein
LSTFVVRERTQEGLPLEASPFGLVMPIIIPVVEDHQDARTYRGKAEGFPFTPSPSPSGAFDRLALNYNMSEGQQDPIESLTPEEASRIIHSHRKVRYGR